ncbi:MAG: hypothetical protein QXR73_01630 [Candidatus Micrarchaeaceae archaeon]
METKITFEKSASKFILEALGCKIDKQGYITRRGKRVKSISNETIKLSQFGGIAKAKNNRWIYVKDDIVDLIQLVDMQEKGKVPKKIITLKGLEGLRPKT